MTNEKQRAIVVGGSLGGLMMALALVRNNYKVTVLEKADASLRNGAFIRLYTGAYSGDLERELRQLASNGNNQIEAWSSIQDRLREVVKNEPEIELLFNKRITEIGQDKDSAWAITDQGENMQECY
ncbi:NAD(P)-binding protein [Enterococcus olivae]